MKKIAVNGRKKIKQNLVCTTMGLCALCTSMSSQSSHFSGLYIIAQPVRQLLTSHYKSCGLGRIKKKKQLSLECKNHVWQSSEVHHIYFYKYAHSSFCVSYKQIHLICTSFRLSDTPKERSMKTFPHYLTAGLTSAECRFPLYVFSCRKCTTTLIQPHRVPSKWKVLSSLKANIL